MAKASSAFCAASHPLVDFLYIQVSQPHLPAKRNGRFPLKVCPSDGVTTILFWWQQNSDVVYSQCFLLRRHAKDHIKGSYQKAPFPASGEKSAMPLSCSVSCLNSWEGRNEKKKRLCGRDGCPLKLMIWTGLVVEMEGYARSQPRVLAHLFWILQNFKFGVFKHPVTKLTWFFLIFFYIKKCEFCDHVFKDPKLKVLKMGKRHGDILWNKSHGQATPGDFVLKILHLCSYSMEMLIIIIFCMWFFFLHVWSGPQTRRETGGRKGEKRNWRGVGFICKTTETNSLCLCMLTQK